MHQKIPRYVVIAVVVISLLLTSCLKQQPPTTDIQEAKMENVVMLPPLNFDLADFIGQKVWSLGFYRDERFTGDGVAFLVLNPNMAIVNEKLTDHSFARLDGDLPPEDINGAEILVYGEVKDFGQTYNAFTLQPTPLITVEKYHIINAPFPGIGWENPFQISALKDFLPANVVFAQEAATGTKAKDCDRALIISGGVDANNNYQRYKDDVIAKFKKLKELGYTDDQIGVIYNDGGALNVDGTNITDSKASKQKIKETLEKYKNEMSASCTLIILVTDHGTGYREDQGYEGARPALAGDGETGKTYAEGKFKVDLKKKVYQTTNTFTVNGKSWFAAKDKEGRVEVYMREGGRWVFKGTDRDGDGWITEDEVGEDLNGDGDSNDDNFGMKVSVLEGLLTAALTHNDNTWDTDGDGTDDVRARWDGTRYVFERLKDGVWQEMGRDTDGDFDIDGDDGGVDWNLDGDKNDQVGFHEGINLWGNEVLWDDELAKMLKPLQEKGIHILVEMMQCFSGGFVNNLQGIVEKIVTAASEDNKSFARKNATGGYDNTFELAFVDNLKGIDIESWDTAFDKAKAIDTQKWIAEGRNPTTKNEYQIWEKPLIETESTFSEVNGDYILTLTIPQSLKGKVHDMEIFFGLQKPRWPTGKFEQLPEGLSEKEVAGGIKVESAAPFPLTPLVFKIKGAANAQSLRIHLTDKEHRNLGYVSPKLISLPPTVARPLEIKDSAVGLGQDTGTTDGSKGVTLDILISEYLEYVLSWLQDYLTDPGATAEEKAMAQALLEFLEQASEADQQWLIDIFMGSYLAAHEAAFPVEPEPEPEPETVELSIPIAMSAESIADDSGCRSTVVISYSATLTGGTGITVTSVTLKVNGEVWSDSGSISTADYHNVVERGVGCGETFSAEVIVTTSDGETITNTASITTPAP